MKNAKHTPGPWAIQTVVCVDRDAWVRELYNPKTGDLVAELRTEDEQTMLAVDPNDDLIMSAPDLLEALERSLQYIAMFGGEQVEKYGDKALDGDWVKDFKLANTAIRKAKGETV